ncbi:transporter [Desulfocarbo indianensis]|nr:transporter [Desulfocarbo indianensis]
MPDDISLAPEKKPFNWRKWIFVAVGLGIFALFYNIDQFPDAVDTAGKHFTLSKQGQMAMGLFLLAGLWWVFEVVPIGVVSIMIGVMQALFSIRNPDDALKDFLSPAVWFIFGSVVLGMAFTKSGLTQRLAYRILQIVGERTSMILLGVFVCIAFMTHFMAHTAVAAAMFPLLVAIHQLYTDRDEPTKFGKALFIGMAWVAGAGSICTFLGAARGVAAVGFYKEATGLDVAFFELSKYMLPVGWVMVFLLWGLIMLIFKPEKSRIENLRERVGRLSSQQGSMSKKEWYVLAVTLMVVGLFMAKSFVPALATVSRPGIILVSTMLFFLGGVLNVNDLEEIPWNIVLLFGGAMSIGYCLIQTGAAQWIAVHWLSMFKAAPWLVFLLSIAFLVLMLTNFIMNVAAIAICLPVALIMGNYLGVSPQVILFSSLVTAGMPFNLLIGAAPNAIAYESRQFTTGQFFTYGWLANIILMAVLTITILVVWPLLGMPILTK